MAAGTAIAIAGGVSAVTSGALAIGGNKRRKRAEAELRNLVPPELRNYYYSDVPLSTYGSRIASQNMAQNNSNMINAAQRGGIRALSAVAPVLTEANIQQNQAIAQDIDRQFRENKMNEAQAGMKIQDMQEARYGNTVAALQQERAAGLQDTYTGLQGLTNTGMGMAMGMSRGLSGGGKDAGNRGLGIDGHMAAAQANQPISFDYQMQRGQVSPYETMIKPQMINYNTMQSNFTGQSYNMPGYNVGYNTQNNIPLRFPIGEMKR